MYAYPVSLFYSSLPLFLFFLFSFFPLSFLFFNSFSHRHLQPALLLVGLPLMFVEGEGNICKKPCTANIFEFQRVEEWGLVCRLTEFMMFSNSLQPFAKGSFAIIMFSLIFELLGRSSANKSFYNRIYSIRDLRAIPGRRLLIKW